MLIDIHVDWCNSYLILKFTDTKVNSQGQTKVSSKLFNLKDFQRELPQLSERHCLLRVRFFHQSRTDSKHSGLIVNFLSSVQNGFQTFWLNSQLKDLGQKEGIQYTCI